MPTYSAPLYQTKCTDLYKSFVSTMLAEQLRLPSNVRVIDSARFTATLNASFYVDDLHLNQKGAYLFAQGLSKWLELDYGKTTETNWATFQVTHDAGFGDSVAVVGSFQGWNTCQAIPCKYLSNNVWSCDAVPVTPGFRYEWKAIAYGTKSGRSCTSPLWQPGPNAFFTGLSGWTPQFTSY
ncbi:hypothetical protein EDD86DRAFT_202687 [Gorgonomyces haynaldii]|nr:hypothetical protein EDD86DRAFT_202687 [Gorgonomyces haynaldii]